MIIFDQIKADREAGTQGDFSATKMVRVGHWVESYVSRGSETIAALSTTTPLGEQMEADARRIARVPQLEAAILALEAVLGELDKASCVERRGVAHLIRERIEEAAK